MNTPPLLRVASTALFAFAGSCLIAGCQTGSGGDEVDESAELTTPDVPLRAGVHPDAVEETRGTGSVVYVADEPGQVFLYDLNDQRTVKQFYMSGGERLAVDGRSGRVTINGNEQAVTGLRANRTYVVYLLTTARPTDNASSSNTNAPAGNSRNGRLYVEFAEEGDDSQE